MIIQINDHKTLDDIRDKFQEIFSFLKIEFFPGPHHWYEESPGKKKLKPNLRIGDVRKKHVQGPLELFSWFKTGDLEKLFKDKFDLNVQVYRLHDGEWVQTVGSDALNLDEQNELGRKTSMQKGHVADSPTERENLL